MAASPVLIIYQDPRLPLSLILAKEPGVNRERGRGEGCMGEVYSRGLE
jgi:hypothetical protein